MEDGCSIQICILHELVVKLPYFLFLFYVFFSFWILKFFVLIFCLDFLFHVLIFCLHFLVLCSVSDIGLRSIFQFCVI